MKGKFTKKQKKEMRLWAYLDKKIKEISYKHFAYGRGVGSSTNAPSTSADAKKIFQYFKRYYI